IGSSSLPFSLQYDKMGQIAIEYEFLDAAGQPSTEEGFEIRILDKNNNVVFSTPLASYTSLPNVWKNGTALSLNSNTIDSNACFPEYGPGCNGDNCSTYCIPSAGNNYCTPLDRNNPNDPNNIGFGPEGYRQYPWDPPVSDIGTPYDPSDHSDPNHPLQPSNAPTAPPVPVPPYNFPCDNPNPCNCRYASNDCGQECEVGNITLEAKNENKRWNADDPFNFREDLIVRDASGNRVDGENLTWFTEVRLHDEQGRGTRITVRVPNEEEEEYYFGAEENYDQWGLVKIVGIYYCGGARAEVSITLDIFDMGLYFRDASGNLLRWHQALYEKDPERYEGFFDPSKKTLLHAHGWQIDHVGRHSANPVAHHGRDRIPDSGINKWYGEGWNVGIFFWTQVADHGTEGEIPVPHRVAERIVSRQGEYISGIDRSVVRDPDIVRTAAGEQLGIISKQIFNNNNTNTLRFSGHSLGAIVITTAADWLLSNSSLNIERLVHLDPAWPRAMRTIFEKVESRIDNGSFPLITWYQTSAYDLMFRPINTDFSDPIVTNQVYDRAIRKSAYVRIHPRWDGDYLAMSNWALEIFSNSAEFFERLRGLQGPDGFYPLARNVLHGTARGHYFFSISSTAPRLGNTIPYNGAVDVGNGAPLENCPNGAEQIESAMFNDIIMRIIRLVIDESPTVPNPIQVTNLPPSSCYTQSNERGPFAGASNNELERLVGKPLVQVEGSLTRGVADDFYLFQDEDDAITPTVSTGQIVEGFAINEESITINNLIVEGGEGRLVARSASTNTRKAYLGDAIEGGDKAEGVLEKAELAAPLLDKVKIHQSTYPNPFRSIFNININLLEEDGGTILVYDAMGKQVTSILTGTLPAGQRTLSIDGSHWSSGIYLVKIAFTKQAVQTYRVQKVE
ncbi:MAG: T9SS type A sorting domain-containing protein, partial [Bacteroidota bacterium]